MPGAAHTPDMIRFKGGCSLAQNGTAVSKYADTAAGPRDEVAAGDHWLSRSCSDLSFRM
jgi:hypothetical protein